MGRPTAFNEALALDICEQLAAGGMLKHICAKDGYPDRSTVHRWKDDETKTVTIQDASGRDIQEPFSKHFARACEVGEYELLEEAKDIADDGTNDYVEKIRENGTKEVVFDSEHVQRSKLRVETIFKVLARKNPGRWGDKIDITSKDEAINTGVIILPAKDSDKAE